MSTDGASRLERFALKGMHLGKMTGVSVGTHAVPDAFLLMHTGVGCKYKAAAQVANHDWGAHPNRREAWTQVAELQLIKGSSERIGPFARSWYERRRPAFMICVSAYFIELTGEDFSDAVTAASKTLPCDMALITTAAPNKGFFDGYASVMLAVASQQDWSAPATRPRSASISGFFFHRYEPDQAADLKALSTLVEMAGVDCGPVLFSGRPYAELSSASEHELAVMLPYTAPKTRKFKKLFRKRTRVEVDLPMGIGGTSRFVRSVAEAAGTDPEQVEHALAQARADAEAQLRNVGDRFRNLEVAVFADTPLAAGLVSILHEMGISTPLVGLRDHKGCLGGKVAFWSTVENNGIRDLGDCEVRVSPSLHWVRKACQDRMRSGRLHGIIGSSHELALFMHQPRSAALMMNVFLIEAGFPSDNQHAAAPSPHLGFEGATAWAQRILNGVRTPRLGGEPRPG